MQLITRVTIVILATAPTIAGCGEPATVESEHAKLRGTWEVVHEEAAGWKSLGHDGFQYEFADDQVRIISKPNKASHWVKYELNVKTDPKQMDWPVKLTKLDKMAILNTHYHIYRIAGDELQIAYRTIITPNTLRPTDFTSTRDNCNTLITLKRIPFSDPKEEQARLQAAVERAKRRAFHALEGASLGGGKDEHGNWNVTVDFSKIPSTRTLYKKNWEDLVTLHGITRLGLHACKGVGDDEMQHVGKLTPLKQLDLSSTRVGDAGVARLATLVNLENLDLSNTSVTDASIPLITKMPKLKNLALRGSKVTSQGIKNLRAERKDLKIVSDVVTAPSPKAGNGPEIGTSLIIGFYPANISASAAKREL